MCTSSLTGSAAIQQAGFVSGDEVGGITGSFRPAKPIKACAWMQPQIPLEFQLKPFGWTHDTLDGVHCTVPPFNPLLRMQPELMETLALLAAQKSMSKGSGRYQKRTTDDRLRRSSFQPLYIDNDTNADTTPLIGRCLSSLSSLSEIAARNISTPFTP